MWRNMDQNNPECEQFLCSGRQINAASILIPLYCKFTAISWLNDCEDMKLVVPTHAVLFH